MLKDTNIEIRAAGKSQQPDEDKAPQKTGDTPELPPGSISADSASEDLEVILPRPPEERAEGYLHEWMRRLSRT